MSLGSVVSVGASMVFARASDEPGSAQGHAGPTSPVTGVVAEVRNGEHGAVESFVLDAGEAGRSEFHIASDVDYGFDLGHLHDHRESGDPVIVESEVRDGTVVALSIEDA